jgi:hypothetical protein
LIGWISTGNKCYPVIDTHIGIPVGIVTIAALITPEHNRLAAGHKDVAIGLNAHAVLVVGYKDKGCVTNMTQIVGSRIVVATYKPGLVW